jgi:hypothetical protein
MLRAKQLPTVKTRLPRPIWKDGEMLGQHSGSRRLAPSRLGQFANLLAFPRASTSLNGRLPGSLWKSRMVLPLPVMTPGAPFQ